MTLRTMYFTRSGIELEHHRRCGRGWWWRPLGSRQRHLCRHGNGRGTIESSRDSSSMVKATFALIRRARFNQGRRQSPRSALFATLAQLSFVRSLALPFALKLMRGIFRETECADFIQLWPQTQRVTSTQCSCSQWTRLFHYMSFRRPRNGAMFITTTFRRRKSRMRKSKRKPLRVCHLALWINPTFKNFLWIAKGYPTGRYMAGPP